MPSDGSLSSHRSCLLFNIRFRWSNYCASQKCYLISSVIMSPYVCNKNVHGLVFFVALSKFSYTCILKKIKIHYGHMGPSRSWSYGSWIYNYLCNQCLSPLKLWVQTPIHGEVYWMQNYVIKFVSDLWQISGFLQVFRFPPPIKLTATI